MNSREALRLLDMIGAETSRSAKIEMLASNASDPFFKMVLKAAYDPFVTYGIKAPTKYEQAGALGAAFDAKDRIWEVLADMGNRLLTGNAAKEALTGWLKCLDTDSADLLCRIVNRDLRCGISNATINQVIPNLVPQFAVQRAEAFEERHIKSWPVAVEPKLDGFRTTCLIQMEGDGFKVGFFSRNGRPFETIDHLKPAVLSSFRAFAKSDPDYGLHTAIWYAGAMIDCEAVIDDDFKATSSGMRRAGADTSGAMLYCFDMMPIGEFLAPGPVERPLSQRREWVEAFTAHKTAPAITKTPFYRAWSLEEVMDFYGCFRARHLEGAMVKALDGPYAKKKARHWLKVKPEETEDLPIIGVFNGEAGTKYETILGGVIVDYKGVHVRVGGGFTDHERMELWKLWEADAAILGVEAHVGFKPGYARPWASFMHDTRSFGLMKRLIEVEYHEVTPDGSLRHPRHVRFRDDKDGELEAA